MTKNKSKKIEKNYNISKILLGVILIITGIYYLAKNTGWIPRGFQLNLKLYQLWPLVIIFGGFSMLKTKSKTSTLIVTSFSIIILISISILMFADLNFQSKNIERYLIEIEQEETSSNIITIKSHASDLNIEGSSIDEAIKGKLTTNLTKLENTSELDDENQKITINNNLAIKAAPFGRKINNLNLKLNDQIPQKIILESDASTVNIDLSEVIIDDLETEFDGSNIDLTLGSNFVGNKIILDGSASTIDLHIPKNLNFEIETKTRLSSINVDKELKTIDENHYQNKNHKKSQKTLEIKIDINTSSLNIHTF